MIASSDARATKSFIGASHFLQFAIGLNWLGIEKPTRPKKWADRVIASGPPAGESARGLMKPYVTNATPAVEYDHCEQAGLFGGVLQFKD